MRIFMMSVETTKSFGNGEHNIVMSEDTTEASQTTSTNQQEKQGTMHQMIV